MATCTYNARTLASEAAIEDLMMQAKKIKYDVIGLTETRRRHPLNAVYETGEELFEQLTTRIGRLRMGTPALTIFVAYAPTSSYNEEEVEAFYMDLKKFYRKNHAFYKKPSSLRWTWESPGGGYRNEIDHIIVIRRFCLTDVAVVPKFYTGSDHRLIRGRFSFTRRAEKAAKFREGNHRTIINWDLFATLAGFCEDSAMDKEHDRLVEQLHDCAKKAESSKTTKRRLPLETLELIRRRGAARAAGNQELTSELARLCREAIKEDLKERRAEVLAEAAEAAAIPVETSPVARRR
ncbi:hypothetical protein RB195_023325 [Necator americanus]|uniref:Endonuclease/exonuclease/phosphatase family protein n=2 Tax=Necator americanus TaxID=51031 RepID=A0ABR1EIQ1_NECAM